MIKTILLVDDSSSIRETVAFFLEEEGYQIIKAENGKHGLDKVMENNKINLILTDLHMPVMDGIEFIRKVRDIEIYSKIPIVLLTTETLQEKKKAAKAAGATAWINKPFNKEQLLKVLKKLLR
ncbi:MAG: hypothetical protein C0598_14660 [Marinilabiliales bacterium]|nr:MAG: hypothetical protein C0598_14660 [Marinilabiliales bacterium]